MSETIHDVFISYSTKDQIPKNYLKDVFDKEGISYFLDEISLELGHDIQTSLETNLKNTRFTVLLVSPNSLFSTWVCLESIHRLQEESFTKKTTFLPVLVDLSVMSLDFPLEMARHFKAKLAELETKRLEAKELGISTKMYNDEIERIEKVLPQISDITQKIKNGLSGNLADENRKDNDLAKLIRTIKAGKSDVETSSKTDSETSSSEEDVKPKEDKSAKKTKATAKSEDTSETTKESATDTKGKIPTFEYYKQNTKPDLYYDIDLEAVAKEYGTTSDEDGYATEYDDGVLYHQNISDDYSSIWIGFDYPKKSAYVKFALLTLVKWIDKSSKTSSIALVFSTDKEDYFHTLEVNSEGKFSVHYSIADETVEVSKGWQKISHIKPEQAMEYLLEIVIVYPEGLASIANQPCNIEYYINDKMVFIEENTKLASKPGVFGIELKGIAIMGIKSLESVKSK